VMNPINDPTQLAEQTRMQEMENILLQLGKPAPVSPRDGHAIHIETLMRVVDDEFTALADSPQNVPIVEGMLNHIVAHCQMGLAGGEDKATFSEALSKVQTLKTRIAALQAHEKAVQDSMGAQLGPEQALAAGASAGNAMLAPDETTAPQAAAAPPAPGPAPGGV
jgi:hypothetical protein